MFKKTALRVAVCTALSVTASMAYANNVDGTLQGKVVTQSSNSALAGVILIVTNKENGYKKELVADSKGVFNLSNIPVGKYDIRVEKEGYKTSVINDVIIGIGQTSQLDIRLESGDDIEVIQVTGSRIATVDTSSSEASFNVSAAELERLPIAPDVTSVALLAPGVNLGDSRFTDAKGNALATFGGASQAENTYYVNGLNMTNYRNGVGGATIPFLAYDAFQVKTGGYSAEFGRSTGGVVSATTKSGTNEFKFGLQHRQKLGGLYGERPSSRYLSSDCKDKNDTKCNRVGDIIVDNSEDERKGYTTDVYVSAPIIKDTLFFYGLYEMREQKLKDLTSAGTRTLYRNDDSPYYLARLDWNINEDHSLMAWTFNDEGELKSRELIPGKPDATSVAKTGGSSWSVRYTGNITDDFSVSAMAGEVEFRDIVRGSGDKYPVVYDLSARKSLGQWSNFTIRTDTDKRRQYRFDANWYLFDEHNLKFGYDAEKNTSEADTTLSGGIYYAYINYKAGTKLPNGYTITKDGRYSRVRNYKVGGTFDVNNSAFYIEDTWTPTDQLTVNLGLRWESFENLNADGKTFIEMKNQFAPRFGISYDLTGDGEHKVFANLGRYHLPVAANTNVRLAGAETYKHTYYELKGVGEGDVPILGDQLGDVHVIGDGVAPSPDSVTDKNLKPMYQDEFMLGYQGMINEDWSFGAKFTHRKLKNVIDDASVDAAFKKIGKKVHHFVLMNPGRDVTFELDTDKDGKLETYHFTAEQLGYPKAERTYNAVDLVLERAWQDDWMVKASYTWSQLYGNTDGLVKGDNGQDDAGLTTDWDYPYLMDGAYGNLPNDRRHAIKVFGSYAVTDNFSVGMNLNITSGRPRNALGAGYFPDQDSYDYGNTFYVGKKKFSRGSFGRTPWTTKFDFNAKYDLSHFGIAEKAFVQLNVYNVFDSTTPTRYNEIAETGGAFNANPAFGSETSWQTPRTVELLFRAEF
ncbi:TonB-dependent receptor [Parashewanella tropica]|uniref:TonB-dependent receptor n=1 Tax=Parashewanella tropica TaxID=2547970 RepID=UPI00105AA695|nr:TonB-dependent receptor [Parashewanella tropica]